MREGWEIKMLSECFKLKSGDLMTSKMMHPNGSYPVFGGNGIAGLHNEFNLSGKNIIIGRVGALCGNVRLVDEKIWLTDNAFQVVDFKYTFDYSYLTYLLNFIDLRTYARQAAQPVISNSSLEKVIIEFPKLIEEQQQIVTILDEAFASIDQAKENLQRNLQNAKDLFQSELNNIFANKGEGWLERKLGDICSYDKTQEKHTSLPYVGLENIESNTGKFIGSLEAQEVKSSTFHFTNKHVLYGRLRPYLNKVLVPDFEGHCSTEIFPILVNDKVKREFLFYWLISSNTVQKIDATWTGARMPRANMNIVIDFKFAYPSIEVQKKIIEQLDTLSEQTKQLEEKYQQKLNSLEELKKSLLQKAFAGELIKDVAVVKPTPIPFKKIEGISATDLQVGLIALSWHKHQGTPKEKTFGHVKSEKIINLINFHLCIDLERNPIKDAAGPNDSARVKSKIDPRAKLTNVYTVYKNDVGSYVYQQGNKFEAAIRKTMLCLGNDYQKAEDLINLFIPMDTLGAEVVATVYSAWNNLILEGQEITDEAIVTEARENWHEAKLKIEREKFFKTIVWMKRKDLIPRGTGQLVMHK